MRISDWSSDVCSSDLAAFGIALFFVAAGMALRLLFAEELGQRATFIFFVPGVVVAGALSGLRAGTLAALAGAPAGLRCDSRIGPVEVGSLIASGPFIFISVANSPGGQWFQHAPVATEGGAEAQAGGEGNLRSVLETVPDALVGEVWR